MQPSLLQHEYRPAASRSNVFRQPRQKHDVSVSTNFFVFPNSMGGFSRSHGAEWPRERFKPLTA